MPHCQFTAHPLNNRVEITAAGEVRNEFSIFLFHCRPVGTVHTRIVEVIAVDLPCFVKNIGPFGDRINFHLDVSSIEYSFSCFRFFSGGANAPRIAFCVQHFFSISRKIIAIQFYHIAVHALLHVVFVKHARAIVGI